MCHCTIVEQKLNDNFSHSDYCINLPCEAVLTVITCVLTVITCVLTVITCVLTVITCVLIYVHSYYIHI